MRTWFFTWKAWYALAHEIPHLDVKIFHRAQEYSPGRRDISLSTKFFTRKAWYSTLHEITHLGARYFNAHKIFHWKKHQMMFHKAPFLWKSKCSTAHEGIYLEDDITQRLGFLCRKRDILPRTRFSTLKERFSTWKKFRCSENLFSCVFEISRMQTYFLHLKMKLFRTRWEFL